MKESVIKELFGEAISYAEKMRVEDEEYYRQLEVAEIKEKELKEGLTENQLEIFEAFLDAEQRSDSDANDESSVPSLERADFMTQETSER